MTQTLETNLVRASSRPDFIAAARQTDQHKVILDGYTEPEGVRAYLNKLRKRDIKKLGPVFGAVTFTDGQVDTIEYDGRKRLPPELYGMIMDLASLYHQSTDEPRVHFTLSAIRDGDWHAHYQTFMTYGLINKGTQHLEGTVEERTPFLFKPMVQHRSPHIDKREPRLVCTFFPETDI